MAQTREAKLVVEDMSKTYHEGKKQLATLSDIGLYVEQGEFVTVIGPSGCGKSTLFNIIAGIEQPDSGTVAIDGDRNRERKGQSGYMLQQPLLLPWRTVVENVVLGLDVKRVSRDEALQRAHELLKRFGLNEFAENYPDTLSGGMRQRVALLRTVLFHPEFLLLDEPFGALDALTKFSLQLWLQDILSTLGSSVLFITHDIREAILLSDRIYVLSARPATVEKVIEISLPRPRRQEIFATQQAIDVEQELLAILMKGQTA